MKPFESWNTWVARLLESWLSELKSFPLCAIMFCAVRQKINISKRPMYLTILMFDFMEIIMIFGFIVFRFFYIRLQKYKINGRIMQGRVCFLRECMKKDVKMLRRVKLMLRVIRQQKYWLLIIKYIWKIRSIFASILIRLFFNSLTM